MWVLRLDLSKDEPKAKRVHSKGNIQSFRRFGQKLIGFYWNYKNSLTQLTLVEGATQKQFLTLGILLCKDLSICIRKNNVYTIEQVGIYPTEQEILQAVENVIKLDQFNSKRSYFLQYNEARDKTIEKLEKTADVDYNMARGYSWFTTP